MLPVRPQDRAAPEAPGSVRGLRDCCGDARGPAAELARLDERGQVERAWKLVYQRPPSAQETAGALEFLQVQAAVAGDGETAFTDFCHMLINSNEFVYVP